MDPNRAYLLAKNGMPGEHIVSQPSGSIARSPPKSSRGSKEAHPKTETMKRRESVESLDSIAREKEEAQSQPSRSGVRAFISKAAKRLAGSGKVQGLDGKSEEGGEGSGSAQRPFEVYVAGPQVMYNSGLTVVDRKKEKSESDEERERQEADSRRMGQDAK